MFRLLTIALLAGAAVPAAALAQDNESLRTGAERREAAAAQRAERAPREDRGPRAERQNFQPQQDRAPRAERQRDFARPQVQAPQQVQAQPQAQQRPDRGNWRDGDRRRGNGQGSYTAPGFGQSAASEVPGNDTWNQTLRSDTTGHGGAINRAREDQRRDANRRRDDDRRDWNRNDQRRDWNDGRRSDNNRRWDGNNRRWDNGNARNWNRSWRNDRRYDWQGYRNSNRYAYRLPRYYAPSGWNYGYRRVNIGAYLFAGLFDRSYWIGDPYSYRLPPVEWPYQWVRYYDDALLVDTETGEVVDSIPGIFW